MKKLFRKAVSVLGSAALVGATISGAVAAAYPAPFSNTPVSYAVVYGASADATAASTIAAGLPTMSTTTVSGGDSVSDDEIALGAALSTSTKLGSGTITDSKIGTLIDEQLAWDDGGSSGSDDYDVHEAIVLGTMSISLSDDEFEGKPALTNDKQLGYRYIFDDAFNYSAVGDTDADTLYLPILGKEYEITGMTANTVTVTTSEEISMSIGQTYTTSAGKVVTLTDVYSGSVSVTVDGEAETISDGTTEKVNGVRVNVDSIGYHQNSPELSKAVLKVGSEITDTFSDGEAYIGEDESDYTWEWDIANLDSAGGYVGVVYARQSLTADDEGIIYVGESYSLPEDFATVTFDGLTDGIEYEDFKISIDDSEDLWNSTDETSTSQNNNQPVLKIEATNGDDDAMVVTYGGYETDTIYLHWAQTSGTYDETETATTNGSLEVLFRDVNGDVSDAIRPRFAWSNESTNANTGTIAGVDIGDIVVGDSTISITATVSSSDLSLTFLDSGSLENFTVDVGGEALTNDTGKLQWFGGTTEATSKETAESTDLVVGTSNIGTDDYDRVLKWGTIIETPESNLDNDVVMFSVPDDQVYAKVTVTVGGSSTTTGDKTFMDSEASDYAGKNIIVVGGSCVNDVAAELLGGAYCGDEFTTATGINPGEFLIETFNYDGKVATLVAGYEQDDTAKGATYLANEANDVSTTVGAKYRGFSTDVPSAILVSS